MKVVKKVIHFSFLGFCQLVRELFPGQLTSQGGWGDPTILLLFLDSDDEIVRIRNGMLLFF